MERHRQKGLESLKHRVLGDNRGLLTKPTVELLRVACVVLLPVAAVADVVEVPARRQDGTVAKLRHLGQLRLLATHPHLHNCVFLHLIKENLFKKVDLVDLM